VLQERQAAKLAAASPDGTGQHITSSEAQVAATHGPAPAPSGGESPGETNGQRSPRADEGTGELSAPAGVMPIGSINQSGRVTVEGRIRVVEIKPVERNSVLACEISDGTGQLTAMFYGRSHIPGIVCGARVRFKGTVGIKNGHPVMINPAYELIFPAV